MRRAFTLIELLVVISIIALLIAILLPQLTRVKEGARRAQCSSNLHQFNLGTVNYAIENDGKYPDARRDDGGYHTRFLSTEVYEYLLDAAGGDNRIFICPNQDPAIQAYLMPGNTPPNGLGYRIGYLYLGGFDHTGWTNAPNNPIWDSPQSLDDAKPDDKILADFIYEPGPGVGNPTVGSHGKTGQVRVFGNLTVEEAGVEGGNVVFVDGSVQWRILNEMQKHTTTAGGGASNYH
jgi:prepilin-type N-terminal cleavage/methylation domain-containing protein/prepilin-type processing-associated H-X9-DG protein